MGLFNLFKKQPSHLDIPQSDILVDMHSHLIPGIDDGAKDMDRSVSMIRSLQKIGYKKLITTPHIMGDVFRNTPENISAGLAKVQEALMEEAIEIELIAAAEYYLDEWFPDKLKAGNLLTLGGNFLLVETSYWNEPVGFNDIMFKIKVAGYKPVLAHPERCIFMQDDFSKYEKLAQTEIFFQINLLSLTGYYSPEAKAITEKLIDAGLVHFAGSDVHSPRHIPHLMQSLNTKYFRKLCALPLLNNALLGVY